MTKGMKYTQRGAGVCSLCSAEGCRDTDVVIPEQVLFKGKVIEIDNYAFRNSAQLNSVVVPEGVVSIGDNAFENCKNLEHILLPQSLKSIGRSAFVHCEKLKSIVLPPEVNTIAPGTFAWCYSLESIDLTRIHAIGKFAFAQCDSLRDILIGDELEEIYASSFQDSGYYKYHGNWENGLLYLGKWIVGCNGLLDEYIITKDTIGIATDVFVEEQHVKRTKNPMYDYLEDQYQIAMVCPQVPIPDFSGVPKYLEETVPVKIRYEGTSEEWRKIIKLRGEKRIPALVTTEDGTIETYL